MQSFNKGQKVRVLEDKKEIGEVVVVEVVTQHVIIVKDNLKPNKITKFSFVKENDFWFVLFHGIFDELSYIKDFPYTLQII